MKGFTTNIGEAVWSNTSFRKVLYTTENSQLVLMYLQPKEDIGEEVHQLDQIFNIASGNGKVVMNGVETPVTVASVIVVPKGTKHNLINTSSDEPLRLYTVYCPPNHKDGVEHKTKQDAEADDEHFDGKTSQ